MRRVLVSGLVALGAWGLTVGAARARPQAVFRAATDRVSIDVVVLAGRNPVRGLTSADFTLDDNGVRQEVDAVSIDALPVDVTLAMDVSPSVAGDIEGFKADIRHIAAELRPGDRVRVVTFGNMIREIEPMQTSTAVLALQGVRSEQSTKMNDGVFYALSWPAEVDRRHLVVAFTDGYDTASAIDSDVLGEIAARADAVLHVVLSDAGKWPASVEASRRALKDAATRTGGQAHSLGDAVKSFKEVFDEFRTSYVLGYTLRATRRKGWHDVTVTLTRPGKFTIRSRKGYFGG
jgi:VWFA-related protein